MKKMSRLPHEQVAGDHDGLPVDGLPVDGDVEGHRVPSGGNFLPGMPGTGGDQLHRPTGSGEADGDDDVEGHLGHTKGERFLPGMPGTGGDQLHRPTGSGEAVGDDDVEGHSFGHTKGERFLPGMPGTGGDQADVKGS
jgi:hypothetical protein